MIETHLLPAREALPAAARLLLAREEARLPDLSAVTVVLPSVRLKADFARLLGWHSGRPAVLLPRLVTLPELAAASPIAVNVLPDARRLSELYRLLRARPWLQGIDRARDLWRLSAELLELLDALTLWRARLPEDEREWTAWLARAYGYPEQRDTRAARESPGFESSLDFEASLVHALWRASRAKAGGPLDRAEAYARRLAAVAREAAGPLYALGLSGLSPVEEDWLVLWATRAPVLRLTVDGLAPDSAGAVATLLAAAWRPDGSSLPERAQALRRDCPSSPLGGRVRLFPAHGLERAARVAAARIRTWLEEGASRVAVVAQDRLAARRLRALLERAGILVEDETGWRLSTTAASSVLMRWLDLLANVFYYADLLDFLKSPLVFADLPRESRWAAVHALEREIRRRGLVAHLSSYLATARASAPAALPLLERLSRGARLWRQDSRPLSAWFGALGETLDELGIRAALLLDSAGNQCLAVIERLGLETAEDTHPYTLAEWRAFLDRALETETFRDPEVESPVVFTHLAATRLRAFDAVLVLGCDAGHLPSPTADGVFFNQAVRAALGLATSASRRAIEQSDLAALIASGAEVLFIWQARQDDEPMLPSPWLDLLSTLHALAWQDDLIALELADLPEVAPPDAAPAGPSRRPRPVLPLALVPARISASGYACLMTCPYQYFARHVLGLNPQDEIQPALEKRDVGEILHGLLAEFHRTHPRLCDYTDQELAAWLARRVKEAFAPHTGRNYLDHAWRLALETLIPEYLAWARAREAQGWRWQVAEDKRVRELAVGKGTLQVEGTLDRIDAGPSGIAVLDYKARSLDRLKKSLAQPGEDVQLALYAWIAGAEVVEAAYVVLDMGKRKVESLPLEAPQDMAEKVAARLSDIYTRIDGGQPLVANGVFDACTLCEMRGLCRRDHWTDA